MPDVLAFPTAPPAVDDGCLSSAEVCALAGVTYRQLDHWTRSGLVPATCDRRGSGFPRRYTPAAGHRALLIRRLVDAGLDPRRASAVLDLARDHGGLLTYRHDGVTIILDTTDETTLHVTA